VRSPGLEDSKLGTEGMSGGEKQLLAGKAFKSIPTQLPNLAFVPEAK
jgi:hypothetical protein